MLIPLSTLVSKYSLHITGVLHVGAHECEERQAYHYANVSDENIYWIEGNSAIVKRMRQNHGSTLKIYDVLVSDKDNQVVDFIITNNGQSSSILELDTHKVQHPDVYEIARQHKVTSRLDTFIATQQLPFGNVNFLNLDIQGAELLALKGLGTYLDSIQYIYTEVNVASLYKDCVLLPELCTFLSKAGFEMKEINMTPHGWGDGFWVRVNHS